jgi:hypothetical protein
MELWCHRDIYSWKSLPSKKQTLLTRTITHPKQLWLVGSQWIDKGNTRILYNKWSSYVSHENGSFTGNPIQYISRLVTNPPHFTGEEVLFDKELSHFILYEQQTLRYAFVDNGIRGGQDCSGLYMDLLSTINVTHLSPLQYKNQPHFISSWCPLVILNSSFQVSDIQYHVHTFLKEMTSSVPTILWNQQYWTILTKCVHYEINKIPLKKYAHLFVVMDTSLSILKYSEFFVVDNSNVSIMTDFHIQDVFSMAYSTSNGIMMVSEYSVDDILKLHWNYVTSS